MALHRGAGQRAHGSGGGGGGGGGVPGHSRNLLRRNAPAPAAPTTSAVAAAAGPPGKVGSSVHTRACCVYPIPVLLSHPAALQLTRCLAVQASRDRPASAAGPSGTFPALGGARQRPAAGPSGAAPALGAGGAGAHGSWRPQDWALEWWRAKCTTDAPDGHYACALAAAEQPRDPGDAGGCTARLDLDMGARTRAHKHSMLFYAVPITGPRARCPCYPGCNCPR
jgi:hypothetical protein